MKIRAAGDGVAKKLWKTFEELRNRGLPLGNFAL